ncbi:MULTISPECIES: aromatic acid exporter family protein [Exiguobacterium]|uniref:aromatic acid exporter family protein n=1 Tax=Exiguobacterium TaxID=33986 RepID=UPI001BE80511|nr:MULTISPECIES: aromatic acid exporter family protein [Exiguobacterium]MCA0980549.1 aromatic acid exporter family protein [Exiguobacterium aestuarii]MDA5559523.1 aromatic acid exporter family protein [Exiguobacterium sp. MMG028]MDE0563959.1 aromatic acid exporter family protein [Exiguobacterium sp. B2(2022)]
MKIGTRTLKTAVAAGIAMLISETIHLDYFVFAAIIAILSIQETRKKSIRASYERVMASLLAIGMGAAMFTLLGYSPVTLTLYFVIFIPLVQQLKLQDGLITSVVILTHLYTEAQFSLELFINELLLIAIGVGVGLVVNMYMPTLDREIERIKDSIDRSLAVLFYDVAACVETGVYNNHSMMLIKTRDYLKEGKDLALRRMGNSIGKRNEDMDYLYFRMRERQYDILKRVADNAREITMVVNEAKPVATFLRRVGDHVNEQADASVFLQELEEMIEHYRKNVPLPTTREEFEVRSSLLNILSDVKSYLILKERYILLLKEHGHAREKRADQKD